MMMKEMNYDDAEVLRQTDTTINSIARSRRPGGTGATGAGSSRPQTNSSDRLFKVMMVIVAFGVVLMVIVEVISTSDPSSSSSALYSVRSGERSKIDRLRDFKQTKEQKQRRPRQTQQQDRDQVRNERPPYHVVFSTSCNDQQHWESYVFFYHANKVQQSGTVTRICSGCSQKEAKELQAFHDQHIRSMNDNFYLHLTPDFADLTRKQKLGEQRTYKYMNKPYGLKHWMDSVLKMNDTIIGKASVQDDIVFLLDPDMILLRPLVHDFTNEEVLWVTDNDGDEPRTKIVKHGFPIAQQDGYLTNQWMGLNSSFITDGGNIDNIPSKDGPLYWNTGPPYIATVKDMYDIASLWCDYAPRVYHIHPKLFAEMFGYIFATTQLDLPHTLIRSIVVSTTETNRREGWPYIDQLPDAEVCNPLSDSALPIGLHYCKRYMLDKWFFSKYRLKKKYISCQSPLLQPPPLDLPIQNHSLAYPPPPHGHNVKDEPWDLKPKQIQPWQAKREAFMLCALIQKINEAARYWKEQNCGDSANMEYYNFFNDPDH